MITPAPDQRLRDALMEFAAWWCLSFGAQVLYHGIKRQIEHRVLVVTMHEDQIDQVDHDEHAEHPTP